MQSKRNYVEARSQPIPYIGCWLWLNSLGSHGYGNAMINGVATVAHRVSYEGFIGPIPTGKLVQHSCDNRWCVNPDHLSTGTDKSNAIDKQRKGRAAKKLSLEDRREIQRLYGSGKFTQRKLALRYNVTQRAIWQVIHRYGAHGKETTAL